MQGYFIAEIAHDVVAVEPETEDYGGAAEGTVGRDGRLDGVGREREGR
jgi:hypothetical protein